MFAKERQWTPSRISQMLSSGQKQPTAASRRRGRPTTRERELERVEPEQSTARRDGLARAGERERRRSETSPLARSPYTTMASGSTRKRRRIEPSADATTPRRHERTPSPGRTPRVRAHSRSRQVNGTRDSENGETPVRPDGARGKGKEASKGQTSQHTRKGKEKARRIIDDTDENARDPPIRQEPTTCDWCDATLVGKTRHRCRACRFSLCSECVINATVVYEEHEGHACEVIPPDGSSAGGTAAASPTPTVPGPSRHIACSVCGVELRGVRWECEQCPDAHLCEDDRRLHFAGHSLRAVGPTPAPRPETGSRRPGKAVAVTTPRHEQRGSGASRPARPAATPGYLLHGTSSNGRGHGGTNIWGDPESSEGGGEDINGDDVDGEEDARGEHEGDGRADSAEVGGRAEREDTDAGASRRRGVQRRTGGRQQQPTHITITVPIEGYTVFAIWARAILDQAPDIPQLRGESSESSSRMRKNRRWLPEDHERLRQLKAEGKTDEQVARIMGRTAGAVGQQWRKQQSE